MATFKYRYKGEIPVHIQTHGLENVKPGDEVEVSEEINHPHFELVKAEKPKPPAKEK